MILLTIACICLIINKSTATTTPIPTYAEYISYRDSLLQTEYKQSLAGNEQLSKQEMVVSDILSNMVVQDAGIMGDHYAPSLSFFDAHPWIDNTSIVFPILKKMPKGAVLHLHSDSAGSYDFLVYNVSYRDYCYMYTTETATIPYGAIHMFASQPDDMNWVKTTELRAASSNSSEFDANMLLRFTIQGLNFVDYFSVWDGFEAAFSRIFGATTCAEVWKDYIDNAVNEMLEDGVTHIEFRIATASYWYDLEGNSYDINFAINYAYELINKTRKNYPTFSLKYILFVIRSDNSSSILPELKQTLQLQNQYPDLIVGFDLVGAEDEGHSLVYFWDDFHQIAQLGQNYTTPLRYYFHAGESIMVNDTNLFDAFLLGAYRIGHGFQLSKHPMLMDLYKETQIGIEVCPISNQLLGNVHDMRDHPFFIMFNLGMPITISPDDPAIYGYSGVSYDWYEIVSAFSIDVAGLKQLAMNSLQYSSFFGEGEREAAVAQWEQDWNVWIDWVATTYSNHSSVVLKPNKK
eukprot:TRINITY_DN2859_c0_g1_i2.p1 TRINITY_DN2859_c0_g1~~TRINITY_DN2859_c0_g1_i2.p1  ORF type:complete len:518 (+),score=95.67 TRINITY_DN2859_c0_g1_i2:220-1773(+)